MSKVDNAVEQEEPLTSEEHLESILFQFVNLYERWAEDRQVTAKQGADIAKFIKEFAGHVNDFALLEEKVRGDIHARIENEAKNIAIYLGQTIGDAAKKEVMPTVKKLDNAVDTADGVLSHYQSSHHSMQWKIIGATAITSIVASLLIVWCLMPKPVLPLSNNQIKYLTSGMMMEFVWPKLSKKEQQHWQTLADQVEHPQNS